MIKQETHSRHVSVWIGMIIPGSINWRISIWHHGWLSRSYITTVVDSGQTTLTLHSTPSILLPDHLFLHKQLLFFLHICHLDIRRWRDT
ncbi:hypothetical protein Hanom_Chr12g01135051 [Helianthus anomalus]